MTFEKKHLLLIIALICLAVWYYSWQKQDKGLKVPYLEYLPAIGGGAYALNFIFGLAK